MHPQPASPESLKRPGHLLPAVVTCLVLLAIRVFAGGPSLHVRTGHLQSRPSQSNLGGTLLAGSSGVINLTYSPPDNTSRLPSALPAHPPQVKLVAGYVSCTDPVGHGPLDDLTTDDFTPSPELTRRLHITPFISVVRQWEDSGSTLEGVAREEHAVRRHELTYTYDVPADLAGKCIWLNATLNDPRYGKVRTARAGRYHVIAPTSAEDSACVIQSRINAAFTSQDFLRALELGDTMLAHGWSAVRGLADARNAAMKLVQYDDALQFLDCAWTTKECVTDRGSFGGAYSSQQREEYESIHHVLIRKGAGQHQ